MSATSIELSGSGSSAGGATAAQTLGAIGSDYADLISQGSNAFGAGEAKIFHMSAGDLSLASPQQIGRVINGVTITASMVSLNQTLLDNIAQYCIENSISVCVEAQLNNPQSADWTSQWLLPAAEAGLPITQVEGDNEVELQVSPADYAQQATNEANIVQEITKYYPNIKLGQWEGVGPVANTASWIAAYDNIAKAESLPAINYLVEDTTWYAPWEVPPSVNLSWENSLAALAAQDNLTLTVLLDGSGTDVSGSMWTAQSEADAATLAHNPNANPSSLLLETWWPYPTSVLPTNQDNTVANAALEVRATYSLYQANQITAVGSVTLSTSPQIVVTAGSTSSLLGLINVGWSINDVVHGATAALVLTDESGLLYVEPSGKATVTGSGSNTVTIDGTASDLAATLSSLKLYEAGVGPDLINVQSFNYNGRSSSSEIQVFSTQNTTGFQGQTFAFGSGGAGQFWSSGSAIFDSSGKIKQIQYTWNANNVGDTGNYVYTQASSMHSPINEGGVTLVGGIIEAPQAEVAGSAPVNLSSWEPPGAFNPASSTIALQVLSTTEQFNTSTGQLQSSTSRIAPYSDPTISSLGAIADFMSGGGEQTTEYNVQGNPGWMPYWSPALASVTTIDDSAGSVVEQIFKGGASERWLSVDNVYSPQTGKLWEQIETGPPVGQYVNFPSGILYVTQFNTGDNPNWNYSDWGNAPQMTEVWQDAYLAEVTPQSPVLTGANVTAAYSTSSAITAASQTAFFPGYQTIFGGAGTPDINTGAGHAIVYLPAVGPNQTVVSGGGDAIWVGTAPTTIQNVGTATDQLSAAGANMTLGGSAFNLSGGENSITLTGSASLSVGSGSNAVQMQSPQATITVGDNGAINVAGQSGTINLAGTSASATVTNGSSVFVTGSNALLSGQDGITTWVTGSRDQIVASGSTTATLAGSSNVLRIGSNGTVWMYGTHDILNASDNTTLDIYGDGNTSVVGNGGNVWEAGTGNRITAGDGLTASMVAAGNTLVAGSGANVTIASTAENIYLGGTADVVSSYASTSFQLHANQSVVQSQSGDEVSCVGSHNSVTTGSSTKLILVGSDNSLNGGSSNVITLVGDGNQGRIGQGSTIWIVSNNNTIQGDNASTIDSYGDNVSVTGGANSNVWLSGNSDVGTVDTGATCSAVGNSDSVIATAGTASITLYGTADVAQGGGSINAWLVGDGSQGTFGDAATIDLAASYSDVAIGSHSTTWAFGEFSSVTGGDQNIVETYGTSEAVSAGIGSQGWESGASNKMSLGDNSSASVVGNYDSLTIGVASSVVVTGTYDFISAGSANIDATQASNATFRFVGSGYQDEISGFSLGKGDILDLSGLLGGVNVDSQNVSNFVSLTVVGNNSIIAVGPSANETSITLSNTGSIGLNDLLNGHLIY